MMSAHWPLSRINHWDVLLQARAIENQAYMIAVNSVGQSGKDIYGGHSTVIAPDGEIIFRAPLDEDGLFVVEIETGKVKTLRQNFVIRR
jgi:predicted amidohydrolase